MANETAKVTIELGGSGAQAKEAIASVRSELNSLMGTAEHVEKAIDRVAKVAEYAGMGFQNWRAIMTGGIAVFSFEQLIRGAMDFDKAVYALSATLNGDAQAASVWIGVVREMGGQSEMLARSFSTFDREIELNGNLLKQMGINVDGVRSGQVSLNQAILQAADYFKAHRDASENGRLAQQLFGLSGRELLPVLQLGSDGIRLLAGELQKYGLTLNNATLSQQMAFVFQIQQGEMAVKGLALQVGNALLPGIAALAQGLARLIQDHLPAFLAGIQRIVSYIIGFVEGLTGMNMTVDDSAVALGDLTQNTGAMGDSVDQSTGSVKNLTQALQDQIKALQEVQAQEDFADRMKQLNQTVADDKLTVAKLTRDLNAAILEGDYLKAQQIYEQLTKAKQKQGNDESTIVKDTSKQQTQSKIDALQDQIRAIEEANQKGVASMLSAGNTMAANFGKAGADAAEKFRFAMNPGMENAGRTAAQTFIDTFSNSQDQVKWRNIGALIGSFIMSGMTQGLADAVNNILVGVANFLNPNSRGANLGNFQSDLLHYLGVPGFATGGIVGGPQGAPQLIVAHGGERVQTREQQQGGGGNVFHIYGVTDPEAVADAVDMRLSRLVGAF